MNHTVLFQQVIIELSGCYELLIMRTLIINLNSNPSRTVFQHKVSITAVLIDVVEMIL